MPRIFGCLAAANLILILATAALGFLDPAAAPDRHVLLAVFTLLLTCLIQVLAFTYLTVTGKVIAQAVHLGRLDPAPLTHAKALKRTVTRTLGVIVLTVVVVTATGAAAWRSGHPHAYHLPAAVLFLGVHLWGYLHEYDALLQNARLLERTLAAYTAQRRAAGITSSADSGRS